MALFKIKVGFKKKPTKPAARPEPDPVAPVVSLIIADVAVRGGAALLRRGVERALLKGNAVPGRVIRGTTFKETVIGTVLAEVARRSVPGAILVGGGLLAKTLSDRRRDKQQRSWRQKP